MTQTEDLGAINGQKVVVVELAKLPAPNTGTPVPVTNVEACLLEDGTLIHRCGYWNNVNDPCAYVNVNPTSVRSHLRHHGKSAELNRTKRELEALKTRAAEIKRNRQNGVMKAVETKRQRAAAVKTAASAATTSKTTSHILDAEDPRVEIISALVEANETINDTLKDFVIIHNTLSTHEAALQNAQEIVRVQIDKIYDLTVTDPKLIELANVLRNFTK